MLSINMITLFSIVAIFRNGWRGEVKHFICCCVESVIGPCTLTAVCPLW